MMNQLRQLAIVRLHVALTSADLLTLEPVLTKVKCDLPLFREIVLSSGILRNEYTDYAYVAGELNCVHE